MEKIESKVENMLANIVDERLDNGLEILLLPSRFQKTDIFQLWCRVGSANELDQKGMGLSHFLEHLLSVIKEKNKINHLTQLLRNNGGKYVAQTSLDFVSYKMVVPSCFSKVSISKLIKAILFRSEFSQFEEEKKIIMHEITHILNDPISNSSLLLFKSIFNGSPYGNPIFGYPDKLEKLHPNDVLEFYQFSYSLPNIVMISNSTNLLRELKKELEVRPQMSCPGKNSKENIKEAKIFTKKEPNLKKPVRITENYPTKNTILKIGFRGFPFGDNRNFPLMVLAEFLGKNETSLLLRRLKKQKQGLEQIRCTYHPFKYTGLFTISCILTNSQTVSIIEEYILNEISRIIKNGLPEAKRLSRIKRKLIFDYLYHIENLPDFASILGYSKSVIGDHRFPINYITSIKKVSEEDILYAMQELFINSEMAEVILQE